MLQLHCPHCHTLNVVHPGWAGQTVACVRCRGAFVAPAPQALAFNEDVPAKRERKSNLPIVAFWLLGLLILVGGVGFGWWMWFDTSDPQRAYERIQERLRSGDYEGVWDSFDRRSQGKMELALEMTVGLVAAFSKDKPMVQKSKEIKDLKGRDLFVAMMERGKGPDQTKKHSELTTVRNVERTGDRATLTVEGSKGQLETVRMVREDGKWKLSIFDE